MFRLGSRGSCLEGAEDGGSIFLFKKFQEKWSKRPDGFTVGTQICRHKTPKKGTDPLPMTLGIFSWPLPVSELKLEAHSIYICTGALSVCEFVLIKNAGRHQRRAGASCVDLQPIYGDLLGSMPFSFI